MKKNTLLVCSLLIVSIVLLTTNAFAVTPTPSKIITEPTVAEKENITENKKLVMSILEDTVIPTATYSNKTIQLVKVFRNKQEAIDSFSKAIPNIYSTILSDIGATRLTDSNIDSFKKASIKFREKMGDSISPIDAQECAFIDMFYDTYENDQYNENLMAVINQLNTKYTISKEQELLALLPTQLDDIESHNVILNNAPAIVPSVPAAVNYANQYADLQNMSKPYWAHADCTNFTSQIRNAGGSPMNSSWYVNTVYDFSASWNNANANKNYWRTRATTNYMETFSINVRVGEVIGLDFSGDGILDHQGFVTVKDSYPDTYGGLRYYDFIVAQHTINYLNWVSSSVNGWELYNNSGAVYYILY